MLKRKHNSSANRYQVDQVRPCWSWSKVPNLGYMHPKGYICLSTGIHLWRLSIC